MTRNMGETETGQPNSNAQEGSSWSWPQPEPNQPSVFEEPKEPDIYDKRPPEELDRLAQEAYANRVRRVEARSRKHRLYQESKEYKFRVANATRVVSGRELALPDIPEVEIRTWPYEAVDRIVRGENGEIVAKIPLTEEEIMRGERVKSKRRLEALSLKQQEKEYDNRMDQKRKMALHNGRPELLINDPEVSTDKLNQAIARQAEIEAARRMTPEGGSPTEERLQQQRMFELATGQFGSFPDPDTDLDHINKVMARRAELEQANYEVQLQEEHDETQRKIREEMEMKERMQDETAGLNDLRPKTVSRGMGFGGLFNKLRNR